MEVKAEIEHYHITEKLKFHGETSADEEVVARLKELTTFLEDILIDIDDLKNRTQMRSEYSARDITRTIAELQKRLLLHVLDIDKDFHDEDLYENTKEIMKMNNYEIESD